MKLDAEKIIADAVDRAKQQMDLDELPTAEVLLKQVLKCQPDNEEAIYLLALTERRLGEIFFAKSETFSKNKYIEAKELIETALELNPNRIDSYNLLALCYSGLGNYDKAIFYLTKAIELKPDFFMYYNNLALQHQYIGELDKTIDLLHQSLTVFKSPRTYTNLGTIYGEKDDFVKAEECFRAALELDPEDAYAHVALAGACNIQGKWAEGFAEYEWRFKHFPILGYYLAAYDQSKLWNGEQDLNGKTILLYGEQGLGDTLQFIRYAQLVKEKGAHVIVHCPEPIRSIVSRCSGVDSTIVRDVVYNQGDDFPYYDYQCSLISLPHLLKCYDYVQGKPYIKPVATLDIRKSYPNTFNIGISWAGSPAHPNDEVRSFPLKTFKPLHDMESVKLFNLQIDSRPRLYMGGKKVDYTEGCENLKIVDMKNMIQSMEDIATIISGLDLVVTCDTAIVHLAGAMGVPCWVLVPYLPDWRWGTEANTHWYNSVRIFRQKKKYQWDEIMQEVKEALVLNERKNALFLSNQ